MIRTIAILVLLAATAANAQLTTTVKRIRLEHATAAELAGTTLDLGHTVFNEENPADLRIGDGATPGGVRVGSDWWTNNMLSAWGGLSRVDVEALVALSIPHVDLTPYAFSADLLDYARLSDYAAATNAIWGSLASKAAASNLLAEAARLDGRIDGISAAGLGALTVESDPIASSNLAVQAGILSDLGTLTTGEVARLDGRIDGISADSLGALTVESDPEWSAASPDVARLRDVEALLALSIGAYQEHDTAALAALDAQVGRLDGRIDNLSADGLGAITAEADPIFAASAAAGITSSNLAAWSAAYGWGDHSAAGYLTEESDPDFSAWLDTDPLGDLLSSYNEVDPLFSASAAYGITESNLTVWSLAYGWGDHSQAGYATWLAGDNSFTGEPGTNGTPTVDFSGGGTVSGFSSISAHTFWATRLFVDGLAAAYENPLTRINNATAGLLHPLDVEMGGAATYLIAYASPPAALSSGAGIGRLDVVTTNGSVSPSWLLVVSATNVAGDAVSEIIFPTSPSSTNTLFFATPLRLPITLATSSAPPAPDGSGPANLVDVRCYLSRPGRTFDLAGHILAVADGVLPLQPVNRAQLDRVADELGARITAITPSENGVRLDGNSILFGNRWSIAEEAAADMDLVIRCQGDEVLRFVGGTLSYPTMQQLHVTEPGVVTMIFAGNTNATYGVEYSTNMMEWVEWTNGVSAATHSPGLMAITITNSLQQVYFRIKASADDGATPIQIVSAVPILGVAIGSGEVDFSPVWEAMAALSNAVENLSSIDPSEIEINLEGYIQTPELMAATTNLSLKIDALSNSVPHTAAQVITTWSSSLVSRVQALESYIATSGNITNDVVVPDPSALGAVRVQFYPAHSDLSNARWSVDYGVSMLPSGGTATALEQGTYPLLIRNDSWRFKSPTTDTVNVYGGLTNTVKLTFSPQGKVSYSGLGSISWNNGQVECFSGQTVTSPVGPKVFTYSPWPASDTPPPYSGNVIFGETLAVPTNRALWGRVAFTFTNYNQAYYPGAPYHRSPIITGTDGSPANAIWGTVNRNFNPDYNAYFHNVTVNDSPFTYCYLPQGTWTFHFQNSPHGYLAPEDWTVSITNGQTISKTVAWSDGAWLTITSNVANISFTLDDQPHTLSGTSKIIGPLPPRKTFTLTPSAAGANYFMPTSFNIQAGAAGATTTVEIVYTSIDESAKARVSIEPAEAASQVTHFTSRGYSYPTDVPVSLGIGTNSIYVASQMLQTPSLWFWYGAATDVVCTASSTSSVALTMTKAASLQFANTSGYPAHYSVDGGPWKSSGQYIRPGSYTITYSTAMSNYFHTPPATNITLAEGQTITLRPTWEKKPVTLTVNLDEAAAAAGAMWSLDAGDTWNLSGATVGGITFGSTQTITFADAVNTNYFVTPAPKVIRMNGWANTCSFSYKQMGYLRITHTAPTMLPEVVRVTLDGGETWLTNDVTLHLPTGNVSYITGYESTRSYAPPGGKQVYVAGAQTTDVNIEWKMYGGLQLTCANPHGKLRSGVYPEGLAWVSYPLTDEGWFPPQTNGFVISPGITNTYSVSYVQAARLSVIANPWPNTDIKIAKEWCEMYVGSYALNGVGNHPFSFGYELTPDGRQILHRHEYRYILPGSYTCSFPVVYGWAKPADIVFEAQEGETLDLTGQYTQ